ncbi:hypothetical protein [Pelagibacterium xiamenense]|uniref:hypothetical protein n=1 Tax=Pelagibacterium xiamenense TaxID=2901140 RepID=UPI001E346206|nr:hypothetical protein [Pelagibacterium xiamenense]MCD7059652.1 hypothetical protein [Pelagibacterium xiamenense]
MPKISHLYFQTGIIFLIIGIGMGLQMAISGVHNVTGAHAHLNLLGWVTSALFGTYYALNPAKAAGRIPMIQYGVYTLGVAVMIVGLYFLLQGNLAFEPLVQIGPLVAFAGVLLFAYVVFAPAKTRVSASTAAAE